MREEDQSFKNKIEEELTQLRLKIDYMELSNKANMPVNVPKKTSSSRVEEAPKPLKE